MTPAEKRQIALRLGNVAKAMQQRDPRAGWRQLAAEVKAGRQVTRNVDTELLRATSIDDPRLAAARQAAIDTMLRFD